MFHRTIGLFFGETRRQETGSGLVLSENRYLTGQVTPRHAHEATLFYLVLNGVCFETAHHKQHAHTASTLAFLSAGEAHTTQWSPDTPGRCFHIELSPAFLLGRLGAENPLPQAGTAQYAEGTLPATLTRRLHTELLRWNRYSTLIVEGIVLELIGEIGRGTPRRAALNAALLAPVEACLRGKPDVPPTLAELAQLAGGVHPSHLLRAFRNQYQMSPGAFAQRLRIEEACRRLTVPPVAAVSLGTLAAELGFADQSHFARIFKRFIGISPGAYRKAHET